MSCVSQRSFRPAAGSSAQFLHGSQQSKHLPFSCVKDTGLHRGMRPWVDCLSRMLQGKGKQGCSVRSTWYHPALSSLPAPSCSASYSCSTDFSLNSELLCLSALDSLGGLECSLLAFYLSRHFHSDTSLELSWKSQASPTFP